MTMTLEHSAPEAVSLHLPFSAESARTARFRLLAWLEAREVAEDTCDDARLLISELVGNSVRHARPLEDEQLRVEWSLSPSDEALAIAVTDGGAVTVPSVVDASVADISGRGLAIVQHLARRWWVEGHAARVTVRAELPLA